MYYDKNIDTIKGSNQELQWLIVGSFRYAVNRHGTQCMWGIEKVIKDNINCLNDEFIRQFIQAIQDEQRWERISRQYEEEERNDFWRRLRSHVGDYLLYLRAEPSEEAKEMVKLLKEVLAKTEKIKIEKYNYKSWRNLESTSYLEPLLEFLQQEYEHRGYKRIEPRD